jgi:putative transposase
MPLKIVTDKLVSYSTAKKELIPSIEHSTVQNESNGCDQYYLTKADHFIQQQEKQMRKLRPEFRLRCV